MEKIETATEANFQEYFVNAMAIPHKVDSFTNLEQLIKLPSQSIGGASKGSRGSRGARKRRRSSLGDRSNKSR